VSGSNLNVAAAAQELVNQSSYTNNSGTKRLYNYAPSTAPATNSLPDSKGSKPLGQSSSIQGIESGAFSLKRQYAFEKLNEREKDMFEEYQKRINDSVNRQAQLQ
jgi:hypothetical protein